MKVDELIKLLKKMPRTATVVMPDGLPIVRVTEISMREVVLGVVADVGE